MPFTTQENSCHSGDNFVGLSTTRAPSPVQPLMHNRPAAPKVGTFRTASSLVCDVHFIPGRRDSMASSVLCLNDPIAQRGMAVFEELLRDFHPRTFAVRLWDGSRLDAEDGRLPRCTLVINHPGAIRRMFLPGNQAALGEAYAYGDVDIEGDVEALFPLVPFLLNPKLTWGRQVRLGALLLGL